MPGDSGGIISKEELDQLADLFARYDGALDPLADDCREAEFQFNALVQSLHLEKVRPAHPILSLSDFRSGVRNECREIVSKQVPRSPCITPEIKHSDRVRSVEPPGCSDPP